MRLVRLRNAEAQALAGIRNEVFSPAEQQADTPLARAISEQVRRLSVRRDGLEEPDLTLDLTKPIRVIADDAMEVLLHHDWPGNVRELENAITRALVLATHGVVHAEHVAPASSAPGAVAQLESLAELERRHVVRVLQATRGNKTKAAEILGVSRPRLNRMLQRHDLD